MHEMQSGAGKRGRFKSLLFGLSAMIKYSICSYVFSVAIYMPSLWTWALFAHACSQQMSVAP